MNGAKLCFCNLYNPVRKSSFCMVLAKALSPASSALAGQHVIGLQYLSPTSLVSAADNWLVPFMVCLISNYYKQWFVVAGGAESDEDPGATSQNTELQISDRYMCGAYHESRPLWARGGVFDCIRG